MFLATCTRAATCKPCRFQAYSCYSTYILAFRRGMNIYRGDTTERLKFLRRKTVTRHLVEKPIKLCGGTPPPPPLLVARLISNYRALINRCCVNTACGDMTSREESFWRLCRHVVFFFFVGKRAFSKKKTRVVWEKRRGTLYIKRGSSSQSGIVRQTLGIYL